MKRTLSEAIGRMKRLLWSPASGSDDGDSVERDRGPDLYECDGCGVVFISRPAECSNCGGDDFSNVGTFE